MPCRIEELKFARTNAQLGLAELQSPTPGQDGFSAELEAPGNEHGRSGRELS